MLRLPPPFRWIVVKYQLVLVVRVNFCVCSVEKRYISLQVSQTMLNHNQNLFLIVSYCFCSFGEFAKVFLRQVWRVRVAHLNSGDHALLSLSRCFQLSTNLDKDPSRLLCWDAATILTNAKRLVTSCVFLSYSETLHWVLIINKIFCWLFQLYSHIFS